MTSTSEINRRFYTVVLLVSYSAWLLLYWVVGNYASGLQTLDLTMAIDRAIPVVPGFVWIYDFCFLLPLFVIALVPDGHAINRLVLGIFVASITACVVYIVVPVANPLPELGSSISERWLTFHYIHDHPPGANKMPSLHVANAFLIWLAVRAGWPSRGRSTMLLVIALLISASTVLVKQHLVIDVLLGAPWGIASWWIAGKLYEPIRRLGLSPEDSVRLLWKRRRTPVL